MDALVERLAVARIGATFNQYRDGPRAALLRERLSAYLRARELAQILLVGEAAGYRGARVSGLPFTSERQLTGEGPAEQTATIVHRALRELGLDEVVLLWNVVPTHPGTARANRAPTRAEVEAGVVFARELARGRRVVAVGRVAERALGAPYVRHPARGGAVAFRRGLVAFVGTAGLRPGTARGCYHPPPAGACPPFSSGDEDLHREAGRDPA
jgi:uracil-DNA glycosylase